MAELRIPGRIDPDPGRIDPGSVRIDPGPGRIDPDPVRIDSDPSLQETRILIRRSFRKTGSGSYTLGTPDLKLLIL